MRLCLLGPPRSIKRPPFPPPPPPVSWLVQQPHRTFQPAPLSTLSLFLSDCPALSSQPSSSRLTFDTPAICCATTLSLIEGSRLVAHSIPLFSEASSPTSRSYAWVEPDAELLSRLAVTKTQGSSPGHGDISICLSKA